MNEFENRLSRQMNTRKQRKIGDIHGCEIELNRKEKDTIGHVNAFKMKISSTLVQESDKIQVRNDFSILMILNIP